MIARHGCYFQCSWEGGLGFSYDARMVRLADFRFRRNERFLYEYDFGDRWQHEVQIERRLAVVEKRTYLICVGGQRAAPPEDCGGPWAFLRGVTRPPSKSTNTWSRRIA